MSNEKLLFYWEELCAKEKITHFTFIDILFFTLQLLNVQKHGLSDMFSRESLFEIHIRYHVISD